MRNKSDARHYRVRMMKSPETAKTWQLELLPVER